MLHVAFARSDIARGRIVSVDADAAREAVGVVAVLTAAELNHLLVGPSDNFSAANGLRPFAAGNRLHEGQRHRHGRADSRRRRHTLVNHNPPVGDISDRGMLREQLVEYYQCVVARLPSSRPASATTLAPAHTPTIARTFGRLAPQPLHHHRIVVAAHRRHDQ